MPALRPRVLAGLSAVALSGFSLAACGDRENESQSNNGDKPTGTVQTNPSTLQSTGEAEPTVTQSGGSVTSTTK